MMSLRLTLSAVLLAQALAAPVLRRSKRLHPDVRASETVSLKHGEDETQDFVKSGSLPVYVPSDDTKRPLVQSHFAHNFSSKEVSELSYSKTHGLSGGAAHCTPANTIFDLGFYDGADSRGYLSGGYCVVGVEADPDLVAQALTNYAVWVATGQLQMANVAIAPQGDPAAWTVFYRNKCSKEWNSFIKTVGCRACLPPHGVDMNACDVVKVTSTDCSGILGTFGMPHYLKLDIEGAETGCFQAMKRLPPGTQLSHYISAEITELAYIDALHLLGYKGFKLVRQDRLATATGSTTGPWGENALDCRTGAVWRDYAQVRSEFTAVLSKGLIPTDPCPGGTMPIHGSPKMQSSYMWYDLHATFVQPAAR